MLWESDGGATVDERDLPLELGELGRTRLAWITAAAITAAAITAAAITAAAIAAEGRDEDKDEFEDFDEEDFDDDFDDDFEEEQDEEYDAENEEYPDNDFGTVIEVDGDIGEIVIDPDIEGDFEEVVPGVEPAEVDEDEGEADVVDGE